MALAASIILGVNKQTLVNLNAGVERHLAKSSRTNYTLKDVVDCFADCYNNEKLINLLSNHM